MRRPEPFPPRDYQTNGNGLRGSSYDQRSARIGVLNVSGFSSARGLVLLQLRGGLLQRFRDQLSLFGGQGGIGNTIIGLFVLGILNNGLDHINIDSFLKILIRGLVLLIALAVNVYAQRMRSVS